jgi:arylsulfatase A-like enzyme
MPESHHEMSRGYAEPTQAESRVVPHRRFLPVVGQRASWLVRTGVVWPLLGLWMGLAFGLAESGVQLARCYLFGPAAIGALQMNRDAAWMIGAANVVVIGVLGLALWPVGLVLRRASWWPRVGLALLMGAGFTSLVLTQRGVTLTAASLLGVGLGAVVARRVDPRGRRFVRFMVLSLPALGAIGAAVYLGHGAMGAMAERRQAAALPAPVAGAPNVLLVVLDTVRADALSSYGYDRPTTPNIDALAARGVRFADAYAAGSWTLPSHASLFTGRWPHELSARIDTPLDGTFPTIAEVAGRKGYQSAGFVANTYFCNAWYGLGRGFLRYADMEMSLRTVLGNSAIGRRVAREMDAGPNERPDAHFARKDAATINREFLDWLDDRDPARPFFSFLNYFDAHDPYLMLKEPEQAFGLRPETKAEYASLINWHHADKTHVTEREVRMARDCYDDCLAGLDREVGELMDALKRRGLDRSTWVVITADHGEQFGDHKMFGHGSSLYRTVTHVPLIVVPPVGAAVSPSVVETTVSLRDVTPTLADLLQGPDGASSPFPGQSLASYWRGDRSDASPAFTEIGDGAHKPDRGEVRAVGLVWQGHSYIRNRDGTEELYALADDPAEENNLAASAEKAEVMAAMRSQVAEHETGAP